MALQKLILEVMSRLLLLILGHLTWPVKKHPCSDSDHKEEFFLKVTPASSEQQARFQSKIVTFQIMRRDPLSVVGWI